MWKVWVVLMGVALVGCNSTSNQWQEISRDTKEGRFEQARAICNGEAVQSAMGARRFTYGLVVANMSFNSCMARYGFTPKT